MSDSFLDKLKHGEVQPVAPDAEYVTHTVDDSKVQKPINKGDNK
jgi:hypothetical protein